MTGDAEVTELLPIRRPLVHNNGLGRGFPQSVCDFGAKRQKNRGQEILLHSSSPVTFLDFSGRSYEIGD
jgi:hypothetical protein